MTFHIAPAAPIPASDVAAVRAWAAELGAPVEVLQMLLGDLAPADSEPVRRKLTSSQVLEVRRLHSTGLPTVRIAERFGEHGDGHCSWAHMEEPPMTAIFASVVFGILGICLGFSVGYIIGRYL